MRGHLEKIDTADWRRSYSDEQPVVRGILTGRVVVEPIDGLADLATAILEVGDHELEQVDFLWAQVQRHAGLVVLDGLSPIPLWLGYLIRRDRIRVTLCDRV